MIINNSLDLNFHFQGDSQDIVFFKLPKILFLSDDFIQISNSAKLLYMLLLDRVSLSSQNNWVDCDNKIFIYYTQAEAMSKLKLGNKKVCSLFKELESFNLISRVKQGFSKPDLIYVKSLASINCIDSSFNGDFKYSRPNIKNHIDDKDILISDLQNKIQSLHSQLDCLNQKLSSINNVENSADLFSSSYSDTSFVDLSCSSDISENVICTSPDMSFLHSNYNNSIYNNSNNNNNSIVQFQNQNLIDSSLLNDGMNYINSNLDTINLLYHTKSLPFSFSNDISKMSVAINEFVNHYNYSTNLNFDQLFFDSSLKLFTSSLINMLTNKSNMIFNNDCVTLSNVYLKLSDFISFSKDDSNNDFCHFNNLVFCAISDYHKACTSTNIKYPMKYMQACIWNILKFGDSHFHFYNNSNPTPTPQNINNNNNNSSLDLKSVELMWNTIVPRLI